MYSKKRLETLNHMSFEEAAQNFVYHRVNRDKALQ